jgi:dethiobiotin synthetase
MIPNGLFITGTDTDIGKTIVTSIIGAILQEDRIDFGLFKPVQSGTVNNLCPDLETYKLFIRLPDPEEEIIPVRLEAAQAPTIAAEMANTAVDIEKILRSFYILRQKHRNLLIEGIGGLMVPLCQDMLVIDFIKKTGMPAVVVTGSYLGTINHTCLTLAALSQKGVPVAGIIFNRVKRVEDPVFKHIENEIIRISNAPLLGYLNEWADFKDNTVQVIKQARKTLYINKLLSYFSK